MIAEERLARWLGNPEAQAKTVALSEEVSRDSRRQTSLVRLEADLAAAETGSAEAALAAAGTFLEDDDAIAAAISPHVEAARADPIFRPPLRHGSSEVHTGLLLFDQPSLSIFLSVATAEAIAAKRVFREGRASITFPGTLSLYRFLKAGGATVSIWEAPKIEAGFSVEGSGHCRLLERRRLFDGEIFKLDGRRHTFVVDHAVSDMVYLQATTPLEAAPLSAEYDSEDLDLVGASSTDEASSRTQMMLSLLREMDRRDAAPVFEAMLGSPHFYVRWSTMRDFLALDAELALPHLIAMAETDEHPDVREAARHTLAMLSADSAAASDEEESLCHA